MHIAVRIALALLIILVDFVTFFIPLGALTIAWVIVARPRGVKEFLDRLYAGADDPPDGGARAPEEPADDEAADAEPEGSEPASAQDGAQPAERNT